MAPKDMRKLALIIMVRMFDCILMPFGMKNAANTFTKTMTKDLEPTWTSFESICQLQDTQHDMGGTSGSFMFCTNEIKGSKFEAQP